MGWQREQTGWFHPRDDIAWYDVVLPEGGVKEALYRMFHRHRPQSIGVHHWTVLHRCACGGARWGALDPHDHAWTPASSKPFRPLMDTAWWDRNSRYLGTATYYLPTIRPLMEGR